MPIETETSAQGRRKKIVAGPAFELTASNIVVAIVTAWTVGKLAYDHVVRLRNSETQPAVLQAELDDRLAALLAGNDDRQAALQAENDVLRRELADARAEIDVLRGNPTS